MDKFINGHFWRSVEDLWNEFTTALDQFSSQCIPTKLTRGKSTLPWITQEIARMIRKRDHIYRSFKKTGDQDRHIQFIQFRKTIIHKIKASCTSKVSLDLQTVLSVIVKTVYFPEKTQGKTSSVHPSSLTLAKKPISKTSNFNQSLLLRNLYPCLDSV